MQLARVVGTCVATRKTPGLAGQRLLLIQPLDFTLKDAGRIAVAADVVSAAPEEIVWFVRSREAANSLQDPFNPVDCAIVGILDELEMVHGGRLRRIFPKVES